MDRIQAEGAILDDITIAAERYVGFRVMDAEPIRQGWLNLKWKIKTDQGTYLIKQYNKERFRLYSLDTLNTAFAQQSRLHRHGLKCPKLFQTNGRYFMESDQGERFMIMEYCEGEQVAPGHAGSEQIRALGRETGKMHRILNDGTLGVKTETQFNAPSTDERLRHWKTVRDAAKSDNRPEVMAAIEAQYIATKRFAGETNPMRPGWTHRDLWADNLLFHPGGLAAILDFDRLNYDYPLLDIARAVISCALDTERSKLDASLASAFMDGYREESEVPEGGLVQGIRWLWYMESPWWVDASMHEAEGPPARFAREMVWLAHHLDSLPEMLDYV